MGTHRLGLFVAVASVLLLTSFLLYSPSSIAQTYVEGEVAGVQDWIPANSPYIATGDLYVTGTLTIQPGVEVLFDDGVALYVENQLAAGTVLFDRNVSNPNPWQGLLFNSTSSGSVLVGCNVTGSAVGVFIETMSTPPMLSGTAIYNTGAALIINESSVSASTLQLQDSILYSVVLSHSDLFLENSTLAGAVNDFHVDNSSHATILNTPFEGAVNVVDAGSDLTVQSYLEVQVLDEGLNPIGGADLNVTDIPPFGPNRTVHSSPFFGGSDPQTNASGTVGGIVVTDRRYTDAGAFDNQTWVEVYYPGKTFVDNPRLVPMDSSHTEVFIAEGPPEPPRVIAWSPAGGNIAIDTGINVRFSKTMNKTSVEQSLRYNDGQIVRDWRHGSFNWTANDTFDFVPDDDYACCTRYNVTLLSTTAKDLAGQYLDGDGDGTSGPDFSWNFTTEAGPPPAVNSTRPFSGEMFVSVSRNILVTFDRPMNKSTVIPAFSYSDGGQVWNWTRGEVGWASTHHVSDTLIFNPYQNFNTSTSYTVTINGTLAKDYCDAPLQGGANYSWDFTTEPIDDDPPQVSGHIPASGQTDVVVTTTIEARFNENMNTDSVNASFSYTDGTSTWNHTDGNVTWNAGKEIFVFQPTLSLYYGRTYTVTLDATVARDASGNFLDGNNDGVGGDDFNWSFITEIIPDNVPPTVVSESPTGSSVDVNENIVVTFSELMDQGSAQSAFYYTDGSVIWQEGDGAFDWSGPEMTFIPDFGLDYDTAYTVTIAQSAMDSSGNPMDSDHEWSFTTEVGVGTVRGVVTDENGLELADVTVSIPDLGLTTHTISNGSYVFQDIEAGAYEIRFSKEGFNGQRKTVDLQPEQTLIVNVTMAHALTLLDLWWMILLIVILVIVLVILLFRRKKKAEETWPGAEDAAYVEPPEEPPPELEPPDPYE